MLLMLDGVHRAVALALEPRSCAVADGVRAAVSYVDNPQLHAAQTLNVSLCAGQETASMFCGVGLHFSFPGTAADRRMKQNSSSEASGCSGRLQAAVVASFITA